MNILPKIQQHLLNSYFTNEHLNGNSRSYQKFIVLSYRRCGSNYFLDLLRSHPQIVAFSGLYEKDKIAFLYPGYPPINSKRVLRYRDHHPIEFLNSRIYGEYHERIKAVGFKVIYELYRPEILEYLKKMPDLKVIHLQRRNLLRLHLSDMIALTTKRWHILGRGNEQLTKEFGAESRVRVIEKEDETTLPQDFAIELKYENCLNEFKKIEGFVEEFRTFFNPDKVHIMYYEDLVEHFVEETRNVLSFLSADYHALTSGCIKINNRKLSEIISNYDELKERFGGTKWAVFFED